MLSKPGKLEGNSVDEIDPGWIRQPLISARFFLSLLTTEQNLAYDLAQENTDG
jgi:hypothetical protein